MRLVTDSVPGRIAYWDRELKCRFVNRAYASWFNRAPEELIGKDMREVRGRADFRRFEERVMAALAGQPSGIYALRASVPGKPAWQVPAGWQWFAVSDLGVTTLSGVDGLHVLVRSLGTAEAKAGVTVELLSRANEVLGTAATDAQGHARFDAGLTRGVGAAAPALVLVRDGTAYVAFLSLTGLWLLLYLKKRRRAGLLTALVGTLAVVAAFAFGVA